MGRTGVVEVGMGSQQELSYPYRQTPDRKPRNWKGGMEAGAVLMPCPCLVLLT